MTEWKDANFNLKEEECDMGPELKINIVLDKLGYIVSAELPAKTSERTNKNELQASIVPKEGQHLVSVKVPKEILNLDGPAIHRYFSGAKVNLPDKVELPKIKIVRVKEH